METMTNELTVIPRTIGMVTRMMDAVNIEDAVIVSEEEQKEHPNFIESNTSGITLEELERNCIVPSFGDNQLTISHQKFIHQVEDAAKVYFTGAARLVTKEIIAKRKSEYHIKSWAGFREH